ncbi:uncharacterized protein LOC116739994 [Phocoena sinus]|uniref:uncharacterized protein LOC116739994 n=1 Tax=Phocoena sinus TaxID=42100 RepID=UPI0013C4D12B|nr:uncharacterized protein LOC116739994 [Phocoena sinus]
MNNAPTFFSNNLLYVKQTFFNMLYFELIRASGAGELTSGDLHPAGPLDPVALLTKFKSHSSGTRMSPPLLGTTGIDNAGPFQNREPAQKAQAGCLPTFRAGEQPQGEQPQEGPAEEDNASSPARRGEPAEGVGPASSCGASITLASPWLPTQGRHPSQQLGDHTPWARRALAALLLGNYSLGTDLLPLPGEAVGRARRGRQEGADAQQRCRRG